jgi:hypothetical protein
MSDAVSDWPQAAEALANILLAENTALRATDFAAAAALLPAKREAARSVEQLTPAIPKRSLQAAIRRLDRLAAENRRLLEHGIAIQSQVLDIIANAAQLACVTGYGSAGKTASHIGGFAFCTKA